MSIFVSNIDPWVCEHTGARQVAERHLIQRLWGGCGDLWRLRLDGDSQGTVILKEIRFPTDSRSMSDARKRRSYLAEENWYRSYSADCPPTCRVARLLACRDTEQGLCLLLEDLGMQGYQPARPPSRQRMLCGVRWLATLHARFFGVTPMGLWEQGTYWHLDTRPDEYRQMPAGPLKEHARSFDRALREARFQTIVHGDAKPANFLWAPDDSAAAVDFQYVGGGCGVRDLAYFLDCCLGEERAMAEIESWLDHYFQHLRRALVKHGHGSQGEEVEREWRRLFPVAWTDFNRFYQGWTHPGPLGAFSRRQLELAIQASEGF